MAVDKRLMLSLLGAAAVVSLVGGWAVSRDDDGDDDVVMDTPGVVQDASIGVNDAVEGEPFPVVDVVGLGGATVSTGSLVGTPLVVNVWYADCLPCEKEMPDLAEVHGELGDRVRFVGIDPNDDEDEMLEFAREHGVGYDLLRDPNGAFTTEVGIAAFPVTLLVTADGTIVEQTGVLDAARLRSLIDEHLL